MVEVEKAMLKGSESDEGQTHVKFQIPAPSVNRKHSFFNLQKASGDKPRKYIEILKSSFSRLKDGRWLDDEMLNYILFLIGDDLERNDPNLRGKNFFCHSHVYPSLNVDIEHVKKEEDKFGGVQRWFNNQHINLFSYDKCFIPINETHNHWYLIVVDFKAQEIYALDSLPIGEGPEFSNERYVPVMDVIHKFLLHIFDGIKGEERLPDYTWKLVGLRKSTRQRNGSDCGVYTILNADFVARGYDTFINHCPGTLRKYLCQCALSGKLWTRLAWKEGYNSCPSYNVPSLNKTEQETSDDTVKVSSQEHAPDSTSFSNLDESGFLWCHSGWLIAF